MTVIIIFIIITDYVHCIPGKFVIGNLEYSWMLRSKLLKQIIDSLIVIKDIKFRVKYNNRISIKSLNIIN